ncbi:MAG: dimethylarginine dimethylaminohydrolase family protein [Candidatus Hodarchaeales archaeon]
MKHKIALVRSIGRNFPRCISTNPQRGKIDSLLAKKQHQEYCDALCELGIEVIKLKPEDEYPDSCFIEDTAVVHRDKALITRMGAESRRGEETSVEEMLADYLTVKKAVYPATIEGGDVLHLPNMLVSGISQRTNREGAHQLEKWLEIRVELVPDPAMVHLKSHVSYIGKNTLLTTGKLLTNPLFEHYEIHLVPDRENYAANALLVNGVVIMATGYPLTEKMLLDEGFEVLTLDVSEFRKCDGALTCLSILI